jgi:ribosomal protein S18 acetylase RimI-like enzyme
VDSPAEIRRATTDDIERLVALAGAHGRDPQFMRRGFRRDVSTRDRLVLLAEVEREPVAYGRLSLFKPAADAPPNVAPAGYYMGGLLVASAWRRRGIAEALTRARIAWTFERAAAAWYFTNARNQASLALHAKVGFVEVTRDFSFPNVSFEGGEGVLGRVLRESFPSAIR